MKKFLMSFILICCIILPCTTFLSACGNNCDLNNAVIANWNNYTHIGAGIVSEQETNTNEVSMQAKSKGKAKLFGVTKDGEYEVIKFKDENNKEKEQTLYLSGFSAFENFTFISYSTNQVDSIGAFNTNATRQYIIDNKTGKLFRLDNIFKSINLFTIGCHGESENAFYCYAHKHSDPHTGDPIYKFSIKNGELKIEKIFDRSTFNAFSGDFVVDKYNNVFSSDGKFIIKADGTIHALNSLSLFKALNGLVYVGNKVFNEHGELIDSTFVPEKLQLSGETTNCNGTRFDYLVKQEGNIYYYFIDNPASSLFYNLKNKLYKVTFINEIEYRVENIALEGYTDGLWNKTLVENDRIYYLANGEVGYCDISTGAATVLTKDYLFDDIWTDNKGDVCFSGLNSTMDIIQGVINENDSITVGIFSNGYDVIFVKPINEFN